MFLHRNVDLIHSRIMPASLYNRTHTQHENLQKNITMWISVLLRKTKKNFNWSTQHNFFDYFFGETFAQRKKTSPHKCRLKTCSLFCERRGEGKHITIPILRKYASREEILAPPRYQKKRSSFLFFLFHFIF